MRATTLALTCLLAAGCATIKPQGPTQAEILDGWKGQHYASLMREWGPPTEVFDDGAGGRILVYSTEMVSTSAGRSVTTGSAQVVGNTVFGSETTTVSPGTIERWASYDAMYVGPDSTIYHWRTNRLSEAEREANDKNRLLTATGIVVIPMTLLYVVLCGLDGAGCF